MTNRFKWSRLGGSIVAIELEMHKREDIEIAQHFIQEIKTKSCHVIDVNVFLLKLKIFSVKKRINSVSTPLLISVYHKGSLKIPSRIKPSYPL